MRILHEKPGAELDWKVNAPLVLETPSGDLVSVHNWSLSGLTWPADAPDCPNTATLRIPFQGVDVCFPVRLKTPDDSGLVQLEGLSGRQRETLALFYRALLSGKMASSGDVITSLDTPVDLVPMEETEEEKSQKKGSSLPRSFRVVINVLTYLLIAAAVVGIIGNNIFTNLDRIDIQHGRVLAPMVPAFAPASGYVDKILVEPGQSVAEGDVLFLIRDAEAEADLKRAETELALAQADLASVSEAVAILEAQADTAIVAQRMATAMRFHAEFIQEGRFDDMRRQWLSLRERNPELARSVDPFVIVTNMLKAEDRSRAADVDSLKAIRDAKLQVIENKHVRAVSDGIVQEFSVRPGQRFQGTAAELSFETSDPRTTIGWVSERFAETIYIGMPASIGFNRKGEKITIPGEVWDVRAGDNPERPGEFGIIVTVRPTGLTSDETKATLRLGAPVNLEAKRQLGSRLKTWLKSLTPQEARSDDGV